MRSLACRAVVALVGAASSSYALRVLPWAADADSATHLGQRLLADESFQAAALESAASAAFPACETRAQTGRLLAELALADLAMTAGDTLQADTRLDTVGRRIDAALSCAYAQPYLHFLRAWRSAMQGRHEDAFAALAISYRLGPREAWVAARRLAAFAPLADVAPAALRKALVGDFATLTRDHMADAAAAGYSLASPSLRVEMVEAVHGLPNARLDALDRSLVDVGQAPAFDTALRRRFEELGSVRIE